MGVQTYTATVETNMVIYQETGNQSPSRFSYTSYHKDTWSTMCIATLLTISGTIYMFLNKRTDKENLIHLHNGILHVQKITSQNFQANGWNLWMQLSNV